jgi:hypothetical protein
MAVTGFFIIKCRRHAQMVESEKMSIKMGKQLRGEIERTDSRSQDEMLV